MDQSASMRRSISTYGISITSALHSASVSNRVCLGFRGYGSVSVQAAQHQHIRDQHHVCAAQRKRER